MKRSDNLYTDNFFKKIGQQHSQSQGNWKNGSQALIHHLETDAMLNASDIVLYDGSGLSRYNLVAPHHFIEYLTWVYKKSPYAAEFLSTLSLGGRDGTLKNRFSTEIPLIRGKTGVMTGVSCISGYIQTKDHEMLAFSIMINGFTGKCAKYHKEIEEPICSFLANLTRKEQP